MYNDKLLWQHLKILQGFWLLWQINCETRPRKKIKTTPDVVLWHLTKESKL